VKGGIKVAMSNGLFSRERAADEECSTISYTLGWVGQIEGAPPSSVFGVLLKARGGGGRDVEGRVIGESCRGLVFASF